MKQRDLWFGERYVMNTNLRFEPSDFTIVASCDRCGEGKQAFELSAVSHWHQERQAQTPHRMIHQEWATLDVVERAGWRRMLKGTWLCPDCVKAAPAFDRLRLAAARSR